MDADDIAELQKELKEKAMAAKQGGDDFGLGGFGGGGGAPAAGAPVSAAPGSPSKEGHPATPPTHARARGDSLKVPATLSAKNGSRAGKSALEMVEYENNRILLKYKKEKYTQAINQAVVDFDQSVDFLMKERVLLEGGMYYQLPF